ncbi:MAG: hypothetical protein ABI193_11570 [Minicystis sp.]
MRWIYAGCLFLIGCGGSSTDLPPAVDVVGKWTAEFLVNTSADTVGDEVSPFGELTMETGAHEESSNNFVGKVTMLSTVYAPQGSVQNPKMDAEGNILVEVVGTATLRGTWSSGAYEGNTSLDLALSCEEIKLSKDRPDLMAVCGSPGFDASIGVSCQRPDGTTTMQCHFGAGDIVFHRK